MSSYGNQDIDIEVTKPDYQRYKFVVHNNETDGDVIISPLENSSLAQHDIIEVWNPTVSGSRALLQISTIDTSKQKGTISICQNIVQVFNFQKYQEVHVKHKDTKGISLSLVELSYKEQYLSRADMWRLKKSLIGNCMYLEKKIEFSMMRAHVDELWNQGEQVTCGLVTDKTRVTFRSSTAHVNIFIQMSQEMWEFDNYGDLYFEKAINGFLVELFTEWENKNHDVTITMFSRTFYSAKSIEDFPMAVQLCIQKDYHGRFYEDFYRVVVQNERYDDWKSTIVQLKQLFTEYQRRVLHYHGSPVQKMPRAWNSTAAEGNFLEVLNMGLNVFEKYYLDRSFDRTGKLSIVITPGVGVFDVERQLANITKQRTIDCGNSSDLVIMGEQPLYAVPLFKFHCTKRTMQENIGPDYHIPHWINHSFYASRNQRELISKLRFVPRIKVPDQKSLGERLKPRSLMEASHSQISSNHLLLSYNYDMHDREIFNLQFDHCTELHPSCYKTSKDTIPKCRRVRRIRYMSDISHVVGLNASESIPINLRPRKDSDEYLSNSFSGNGSVSIEDDFPHDKFRQIVGSADTTQRHLHEKRHHQQSLVNPFAPSLLSFKVTSNRRRWAHAFPTDLSGASIQTHHRKNSSSSAHDSSRHDSLRKDSLRLDSFRRDGLPLHRESLCEFGRSSPVHRSQFAFSPRDPSYSHELPVIPARRSESSDYHNFLWGITGEQEWTPFTHTGMDWKSMTMPASLPLTTDYIPDGETLKLDYLLSEYHLLPDDMRSAGGAEISDARQPLSTKAVYDEMIAQRISQGFQIINVKADERKPRKRHQSECVDEVHWLSIGRIFHKLTLSNGTIKVHRYCPKHPYPSIEIEYRYRFQVPDSEQYTVSWTRLRNEKLEEYLWNQVDHYIRTKGEDEYPLNEGLKYWRARFFLLPLNSPATAVIQEQKQRCDIYQERTAEEMEELIDGFIRFTEFLNKIKRGAKKLLNRSNTKVGEKPMKLMEMKSTEKIESDVQSQSPPVSLSSGSDPSAVIEAMLSPSSKMSFVGNTFMPLHTFVSYDATLWVRDQLSDICTLDDACRYLQSLIDLKKICHASGDSSHKFFYGFYFYCILGETKVDWIYRTSFQFEWCEVEVGLQHPQGGAHSLPSPGSVSESENEIYKKVHVDTDPGNRSERKEWGTACYHALFNPACAFEMEVRWLTSTGPILGYLINGWARKANICKFHLLPVPGDPFALPYNRDSDPLRGPIFVPLRLSCIAEYNGENLALGDFQLKMFQISIIKRFGFMPDNFVRKEIEQPQFVHCTGAMFIMLPQSSAAHDNTWQHHQEMGFFWAWNFVLTKKWKSQETGDETFQNLMLADFQAFCRNDDNRLEEYWQQYATNKEQL